MESGIYQTGQWHIPKWKVAYTRMESGICRNEKWHIPEWKVAYAKMESGIYQNEKWHMPKWKVAYTRVESGIYQSGIPHIYMWNISIFFLCNRYCMIDHDIDAGPCSRGRAQTQAFPPNAWINFLYFNALTSCPKSEPHQRLIGFYGEHITPAIVYRYTQGITQGKPCLWHQRLAVELWQASISTGWPLGRQDRTDSQKVQVWSGPARLGDQKCPEAASWRGRVQLKIYDMHIPDIYLSYMTVQ